MKKVYDFTVKTTNGDLMSLNKYEGKPLLIVNTASKCGLTPQFAGLQELYDKYQGEGFTILGFPCDQFNNQEFENIEETTAFCQMNYGVTFPIFAKVNVNGELTDPLFDYLKEHNKAPKEDIEWNFSKFLIDRKGQVVERYAPAVEPAAIEEDLLKVL